MNNRRNFDALLLDFDGTYADTAPDMVAALNSLLSEHDRPQVTLADARAHVSHGSRALVRLGFPEADDATTATLINEFLQTYEHALTVHTRPFDGMNSWLQSLAEQGINWGIVTNKPAYLTARIFRDWHLEHPPQCVVAGDSLTRRKPHPMPVLHAAALLQKPARRCIYVGDARADIAAGQAAGMYTIVAQYGYILPGDDPHSWDADRIATSVDHLQQIIDDLLFT